IPGGGYIGVEVTDELSKARKKATIVEMMPNLLTAMDQECSRKAEDILAKEGAKVVTGKSVRRILGNAAVSGVELSDGSKIDLVPTRPPAEPWIAPPDEIALNAAYQIISDSVGDTELLIYNEGTDFTFSGDAEKELLAILAVHPMSRRAVEEFLAKSKSAWDIIERLVAGKVIREVEYSGNTYYMKNLKVGI
ncbi:MAG TPA: FAD-dependent oxidoreductase, partial [Candidatus Kryptobacter bacterium]|nr:FAD-dependent oxidoreductase [Candidatus Kryptobacter bacterium]